MTWDLDKEESRDGRSGYDLRRGLTGCDGGIDERQCEDGFFASLSVVSNTVYVLVADSYCKLL
jgi:hypothetical protein